MNEMAAQSLLAEHFIADSADLALVYRSFWRGLHAAQPDQPTDSLVSLANEQGLPTTLLTDAPELESVFRDEPFQKHVVTTRNPVRRSVRHVEETRFAELVVAATELLHETARPAFLWVHASGLNGEWDAPHKFREELAAEDDPAPPTFLYPPVESLDEDVDPDYLFGLSIAYAAQVQAIDDCLVPLWNQIKSDLFHNTLFVFTSPRGFPLGEHRTVGDGEWCPFSESLHLPWFVRFPRAAQAGQRVQTICQPADLYGTIRPVLDGKDASPSCGVPLDTLPQSAITRAALSVAGGSREAVEPLERLALRTPSWHYCTTADSGTGSALSVDRLYAKPDDIWEVNDVASLCPDIVAKMKLEVARFRQTSSSGSLVELGSIDEELSLPHF